MSTIDWSKAPEGATHFCPARKTWLKQGEHCMWLSWSQFGRINEDVLIGWTFCHPPENESSLLTKEWSGEGLPPAGIECEVTPHNNVWGFNTLETRPCSVLAYHADFVWIDLGTPGAPVSTRTDKVDFTPIRTAEQIAADEREKEIKAMIAIVGGSERRVCIELYEAGYRKP